MLERFTGIIVTCTMRSSWNGEIVGRIKQAIKTVIGYNPGVAINRYLHDESGVTSEENFVEFSTGCDVSPNVELERKRCCLLVTVLKGIINEQIDAEAYLDGFYLVSTYDSNS